ARSLRPFLKAWIGGWSDRSGRGVRWRQGNRKEPGNPHFYWKKDAFRDSLPAMDATDLARENALLKARLAEVEASLAESQEANRRLQDILRIAQREKFGKRSEKLSPDQFNLPLEDAEFAQGVLE